MSSSVLEEHVLRNNDRLVSLRQLLHSSETFASAARELLDWCSDDRAFQNHFQDNLFACLDVVRTVCRQAGFEANVGYRLLTLCYNNRHNFSPANTALLERWKKELGSLLLRRYATDMDFAKNPQQQHVPWPGQPTPRAVAVLTTVYPGYESTYSNPSYKQSMYYGPSAEPSYPNSAYQRPAVQAAVHAAAVATATATAIAVDQSQMQSPQYPQSQVPLDYQQQSPNYMVRSQYPSAARVMPGQGPPAPMYRPSGSQIYQRYPAPPQYQQAMVQRQNRPQYAQRMQYNAQNGQYLNGTAPVAQGGMRAQMNGAYYPPRQMMPVQPTEPRPAMPEVPTLTIPIKDNIILQPFGLQHGVPDSQRDFILPPQFFNMLKSNPEYDLQLKCFHREDHHQSTAWPHYPIQTDPSGQQVSQAPSVEVRVNGNFLPLSSFSQPLYIKHLCKPDRNQLLLRVCQCCCSHFFMLQLVSRRPIEAVRNNLLQNAMLPVSKAMEKLRHMLSGGGSGPTIEKTKCSVQCPISRRRIDVPARGVNCTHPDCFDLVTFLAMYGEKKPMMCAVCSHPLSVETLEIDGYQFEILRRPELRNPSICEFVLEASGNWSLDPGVLVKQEVNSPGCASVKHENPSPGCAPPAKRLKTEVGALTPPASYSLNSQWPGSPIYSPRQPPLARYGPGTPVTPLQNPPSVGQPVENPAQTECGSIAGSAPYTPASVGSAGSNSAVNSGLPPAPSQSATDLPTADLDGLPFDSFLDGGPSSLLSDLELQQYLDQTDLSSGSADFGTNLSTEAPKQPESTADSNPTIEDIFQLLNNP